MLCPMTFSRSLTLHCTDECAWFADGECAVVRLSSKQARSKSNSGFAKPTVQQVDEYIKEKGYRFSAEAFVSYYESNGWKVGKNPMKNWKAACQTWARQNERRQVNAFDFGGYEELV